MSSTTHSKSRIAKNSITLYVRMLFTMFINLYTTRLVLENLGVEDYGVYGVVGGVVGLISVFKDGIIVAIQRFITFESGKKDGETNRIFCTSLNAILILAIVMFVIMEFAGMIILKGGVNIPENRLQPATFVLHFCVIASLVELINAPYNAIIIAHERIDAYALISILQVVLTCIAAYFLSIWDKDIRLPIYAVMIALIGIFIRIIYQMYCRVHFIESKYRLLIDINVIKKMGKFAGISTASGILHVAVSQGIVLMINLLYGVAINAVYMIGRQLMLSFMSFGINIYRAISPQIIKTYANEEFDIHKRLVYVGCKMDVFMILFILIPFFIKTEYILDLWLKEVPFFSVPFARWSVVISILYAFTNPITDAVSASNRIMAYMIIPDVIYALVFPIGLLVYYFDNNPVIIMYVIVSLQVIMLLSRIFLACKVTVLGLMDLMKIVVTPCFMISALSIAFCLCLRHVFEDTIMGICLMLILNSIFLLLIIYLLGLSKKERIYVRSLCTKIHRFTL